MSRLAILLWATDLDRPGLAAAPFVYAAAAAALDAEVEIHFAGRSVRLLVAGEAARRATAAAGGRSLYDFMQDAARGGARFLACSMAWREYVAAGETTIPEFAGHAGATAFVARTLDPDWRTLVF
ncbi:DsrE family protein [Azospira restricta]|uniref:DsrE family protein n=1 Tax=Azospira restricta TaxID=404405 RepID=A0A974SQM9_9RHOO|nr:DsrE family protein [Azospira restricta]QRJ64675.1 DsrE family protein [Azospira restricta]